MSNKRQQYKPDFKAMDGRGRYQDNILVERLWWTVNTSICTCRLLKAGQTCGGD